MYKIIYRNLFWLSLGILMLAIYQILIITVVVIQIFSQPIGQYLENYLVSSFWFCALFILQKCVVLIFRYSGDNLDCDESALIVSNHASWFDFLIMAHVSNNYSMLEHLRFLAWRTVYSIPSLRMLVKTGIYTQNWAVSPKDLASKPRFSTLFEAPSWIVLFPEVDICTPSHQEQHNQFCKENYLPEFQHLLYPRFSAFVSLIQALSNKGSKNQPESMPHLIQNMYCFAISYNRRGGDTLVSLSDYLTLLLPINSGRRSSLKVHIHVTKVPIKKLPIRRRKLEKWLEKRWLKNDQIISSLKS